MSTITWICIVLALGLWFFTPAEDNAVGLIIIVFLVALGIVCY
jgi:hypothetical protein